MEASRPAASRTSHAGNSVRRAGEGHLESRGIVPARRRVYFSAHIDTQPPIKTAFSKCSLFCPFLMSWMLCLKNFH